MTKNGIWGSKRTRRGWNVSGTGRCKENQSQLASADEIPLASAAAYLQQGYGLIYPSPVAGNFTNETLLWLENYNTQDIVLEHLSWCLALLAKEGQ